MSEGFRETCITLLNQLLNQGFQHPVYFAAIAMDGLTTSGSSETVTGAVQPLEKTGSTSGARVMYLLPVNVLFVDPRGQVAHGVIHGLGSVSCRVLD
jgi:hypothetical protein